MDKLIDRLGRPSAFDSWENYMGERPNPNLYCVLVRNRDSDLLTNSNWDCAIQMFKDAELDYEITNVGHWLCGWIEYLSVDINDKEAFKMGEEIEASLSDYPVLNEEDYCEREHEDFISTIEMVYDDDFNVGEDFDDWSDLAVYLNDNGYYHHEGSSPSDEDMQQAMWDCYLKERLIDIARGLAEGESVIDGAWEISKISSYEATAHHECEDSPRVINTYRDHPNQILIELNLK